MPTDQLDWTRVRDGLYYAEGYYLAHELRDGPRGGQVSCWSVAGPGVNATYRIKAEAKAAAERAAATRPIPNEEH